MDFVKKLLGVKPSPYFTAWSLILPPKQPNSQPHSRSGALIRDLLWLPSCLSSSPLPRPHLLRPYCNGILESPNWTTRNHFFPHLQVYIMKNINGQIHYKQRVRIDKRPRESDTYHLPWQFNIPNTSAAIKRITRQQGSLLEGKGLGLGTVQPTPRCVSLCSSPFPREMGRVILLLITFPR